MNDFYRTMMGKKFFEADLPRLIRALEGLQEPRTKEEELDELAKQIFISNDVTPETAYKNAQEFIDLMQRRKKSENL